MDLRDKQESVPINLGVCPHEIPRSDSKRTTARMRTGRPRSQGGPPGSRTLPTSRNRESVPKKFLQRMPALPCG